MGGNALSRPSVRLQKGLFEQIAREVVTRLKSAYPENRVHAIEAYSAKDSFGDLDVLIESKGYHPNEASKALGAVEVVRNGPVTSVGIEVDGEQPGVFQVDLIATPPEAFEFASRYFAFNDAGNLFGRIAHAMGTALRHDALVHYLRDGDYRFGEIVLTRDYDEALRFLGYDPVRFAAGFETLEDIFRYVASTPLFSRDVFLLHNRNHRSRVRDRKRPTYMAFLAWCEAHPELSAFAFPADKNAWLGRIAEHFPHFGAEYNRQVAELAEQRAVRMKFNGELVAQWTGLAGKELGRVMRRFRESFETEQAQQNFVLTSDESVLRARVDELCQSGSRGENV